MQFNPANLAHVKTVNILDRQGYHGKAQYVADAVLYYENVETPDTRHPTPVDEKCIEAVVEKVLRVRSKTEIDRVSALAINDILLGLQDTEVSFDDAEEVLGNGYLKAVTGTLAAFRNK